MFTCTVCAPTRQLDDKSDEGKCITKAQRHGRHDEIIESKWLRLIVLSDEEFKEAHARCRRLIVGIQSQLLVESTGKGIGPGLAHVVLEEPRVSHWKAGVQKDDVDGDVS